MSDTAIDSRPARWKLFELNRRKFAIAMALAALLGGYSAVNVLINRKRDERAPDAEAKGDFGSDFGGDFSKPKIE